MNIKNIEEIRAQVADPGAADGAVTAGRNANSASKHEVISRIAFMIGVEKRHFENGNEPPEIEIYNELLKIKSTVIIRDLCILRSAALSKYTQIFHRLMEERYRSIAGLTEYIPADAGQELIDYGINIYQGVKDIDSFLYKLNSNIKDRVNNCREIFPDWINWDYVTNLFVMPNGTVKEGLKAESIKFHENTNLYPYQKYIHWPVSEQGNILYDDRKFVTLMYDWHDDRIKDLNLVCGVKDSTKETIYDFIEESGRTVFVVDCENSDPYALCAAINNLDREKLGKIEKVILFDDVHAASAWELLGSYVNIPVEYEMITRIVEHKSLADMKVAVKVAEEHLKNDVDSFVLVSSDSDYWGLIESLSDAKFLVMVEHGKFGYNMKNTLYSKGIFYCYIDNFYAGDGSEIKNAAIRKGFARLLKNALDINLDDMMDEVLCQTRITMDDDEKKKFIKRYIKPKIKLEIDDDNNIMLECRA